MNNFDKKEFWSIVVGGSLLTINAGFINVVTLAGAFSVTVSHLTGNVSRLAITLSHGDWPIFASVFCIIISFMFGAFIAGYMVGDHKFKLGHSYGVALMLEAGILFLSFLFLKGEWIIGEWCAAFACGLQNALTTNYSGAIIRTTHMTGMVTDIGNLWGQFCREDGKGNELWRMRVMLPLLGSYFVGGLLGQLCFFYMRENAMLLPSFFVGGIGCLYLSLPFVRQAQEKIKEAQRSGIPPPLPLNKGKDVYERLKTKNVDLEMEILMNEMDNPRAPLNAPETVELMPVASHNKHQ